MTLTLYNCRHSGDQYRITKFEDGNPTSSYLTTHAECDCPAGSRPTCRHRQMLPNMLQSNLFNSDLFWNFDRNHTCDINGHTAFIPIQPNINPYAALPINANIAEEFSKLLHPVSPANPKPWRRL